MRQTCGSRIPGSVASHRTHKGGGHAEEYEDAYRICPPVLDDQIDVASLRIALSDGASESALAGLWARSLVDHFAGVTPEALVSAERFGREAVAASASWPATLSDYVAGREADGRPIQWYEQPKLDRGAYATLLALGFRVSMANEGQWFAAAIGDCCLFQVRDDSLITTFPLAESADFGTSPDLLNSRNQDSGRIVERVAMGAGSIRQQDDIYLCTDAVAAWFLREAEHGGRPWEILRDLGTADGPDFAEFVGEERLSGRMRNDDATLIHVSVW
ncbi:hypothetical protein ITP53_10425 [Nonomuraea sp. K274]|uniref:Protein phosphatase 2C-like protein n=1 Tax=Nonomuraea cypriaca TaxID=1187855 RepID=A0A931EZG3_9ACTN|nr:hypothetical protein [Nonomuraea cypriaca]MBF8186156.1 hypothetical protein [Nonomuraea cypriaca]